MEFITSRKNPQLQRLRKLNASASFRRQQGLFVCEGPKLLEEAVRWQADIRLVVKTPEAELPPGLTGQTVETSGEILASLADTQTPQGVIFVCRYPETLLPDRLPQGRYLVLDGVQDPGNLGTVWRTADALGARGVILTGACADPFGPKTVRSTMGACFRLPVWKGERQAVAEVMKRSEIPLYATALRADTEDVRKADLSQAAVVIGSEGNGVSEELLALCEKTLKIPMTPRCESLNAAVAAAIVLWEGYQKQR